MAWTPRDFVAFLLAACVLVFIASGTSLRILLFAIFDSPTPPPIGAEQAQAWENIINVIVGVLAAYISGRAVSTKREPPNE